MTLTFGEMEGKTYGEIQLEARVRALEEAMRQIYPHAHCHPEDCPHPMEVPVPSDEDGKQ